MNLQRLCYTVQPDRVLLDGEELQLPLQQRWSTLVRTLRVRRWERLELFRDGALLRVLLPADVLPQRPRRALSRADTTLAERIACLEVRVAQLEAADLVAEDDSASPLSQLPALCAQLGVDPAAVLSAFITPKEK